MRRRILLLLGLLLAGCSVTPTPTSTLESFPSIGITPELETTVLSWVSGYREEISEDIIQVKTYSPEVVFSTVQSGESNLIITALAPPEGWFATPLSRQQVVVVVNLENEVQALTRDDLQAVFSGRTLSWVTFNQKPIPVQPIVSLQSDATRKVFENAVMKGVPFSPSAFLAPTPTILLDLIEDNVGSIGFLLQNDVSDKVRQISLDEDSAGSATGLHDQNPLWIDILAVSMEEPLGDLREFLVWLQTEHMQ